MQSIEKVADEFFKVDIALTKLGIDEEFVRKYSLGEQGDSVEHAMRILFKAIHLETGFGTQGLPAFPVEIHTTSQYLSRKIGISLPPAVDKFMKAYSTDVNLRAQIYGLYKDYVLPNLGSSNVQ